MFFVITNIYNKKTKGPTLMELFTTTGKMKKFFFFWQLEMFVVFTTGDTAHIDTIFKLLPHTRQHVMYVYIVDMINARKMDHIKIKEDVFNRPALFLSYFD
jgi:hypothetical protein